MKNSNLHSIGILAIALSHLVVVSSAFAQGNADSETTFKAMLKNATLKGTWAPIQQGKLGDEKGGDRYRISRVEKTDNGKLAVVSLFTSSGLAIQPVSWKTCKKGRVPCLDIVR